jgi:hypothetical protein
VQELEALLVPVDQLLEGRRQVAIGRDHRDELADAELDLRLRIYRRKFMVKFLNNLLAQMTPFLFYCIGGVICASRLFRNLTMNLRR